MSRTEAEEHDAGAAQDAIDAVYGTLKLPMSTDDLIAEMRGRPQCPCYSKDMARVTSKLQVTIPKVIADHYAIEPGQEIEWLEAGDAIRIVPQSARARKADRGFRVELFDAATARQRERQRGIAPAPPGSDRGWTRDELYERDRAR